MSRYTRAVKNKEQYKQRIDRPTSTTHKCMCRYRRRGEQTTNRRRKRKKEKIGFLVWFLLMNICCAAMCEVRNTLSIPTKINAEGTRAFVYQKARILEKTELSIHLPTVKMRERHRKNGQSRKEKGGWGKRRRERYYCFFWAYRCVCVRT